MIVRRASQACIKSCGPSFVPLVLVALLSACSSGTASPSPSAMAPSGAATVAPTATDPWSADLEQLDRVVRFKHSSPFTIHTEAEWNAKLAEIRPKLAAASPDGQFVLVASLVGLLDTHTSMAPKGGLHAYEVLFYKFPDGWFVVAAKDKTLIGSRLISIGGHPVSGVEATLRALVPHDNESGFLINGETALSDVEFLHGSGIVSDPARPQFLLEDESGNRTTVDFTSVSQQARDDELGISGYLIGAAPEAVARRNELAWTRLDAKDKAFLISVNDYGDTTAAVAAMRAALDSGAANRVVLDVRYLRGGSGDFKILDALRDDPRVDRPGGLTVLISRENESAGTQVAWEFDVHTQALLVGEPTPARADNFRCDCFDIVLPNSGIVVTVPTSFDNMGDLRPEVPPDILMTLSSVDFFAGRDPVLDAALRGLTAPPTP